VLFDLLPPVFSSVQALDLVVFVRLAASFILLHSTAGVAHLFCVLLRSRQGWALSVDCLDPHLGPRGIVSPRLIVLLPPGLVSCAVLQIIFFDPVRRCHRSAFDLPFVFRAALSA
jgi:hypothetical protein